MQSITTKDKIKALKREIAMREAVYPRQVERGKMTRFEMEREITVMKAILADYLKPERDLFN